jgi:RNA recognition motif-containing protein
MSYSTTEDTLRAEFGAHGEVSEVAIIMDRETGRPRGFAFVTMPDDDHARQAIEQLNGAELDGRRLLVNEAKERESRGGGGGGFRSGGGGGGGFRGGDRGGRGGRGGGDERW